jgi:predicted transcriptional regulator
MGIKISKKSYHHGNILGDFANILECSKNEVLMIDIMKGTKWSGYYIREYIDFLVKKNLLKSIPFKKKLKKYKTTKKGFKYLKKYYEIMKILDLK